MHRITHTHTYARLAETFGYIKITFEQRTLKIQRNGKCALFAIDNVKYVSEFFTI